MKDKIPATVKKKKKLKRKLIWLVVHIVGLTVIITLLLLRPKDYTPLQIPRSNQVSRYLTNVLLPQFYNGSQTGEAFDVVVTQKGLNDIVARSEWPKQSGDASFTDPAVLFEKDAVVLMGKALLKEMEFVVTIVISPQYDEKGLLNLRLSKVRIGLMNVTLLARATARKMYQQQMEFYVVAPDDWNSRVLASILNNEPFEPEFKIDNKKLRIDNVTLGPQELFLHVVPVSD
ncbi:MAG: hypothetical protein ACYSWP_01760 [Planctomycetota bacterium]|jgi:hypothetical protein